MGSLSDRYGTVLRCYDNGGKTLDRYTIVPPRWAKEYRERSTYRNAAGELVGTGDPRCFSAIAASADPFYALGFGQYVSAMPGRHLGKRVRWDELPTDVQRFAREAFPEYAPHADLTP